MYKSRKLILFLSLCGLSLCTSCNKYDGFKKHSSGFYYKYYVQDKTQPSPEEGDFVEINMSLHAGDNQLSPMTKNSLTIDKKLFRGDLYTALKTMHLGDSATLIFNGRKFYEKFLNMGDYPYGKEPIVADIKLCKVMSKKKIELAEENYKEQNKRQREIEDSIIKDYVAYHHIELKRNGIYRIFNKRGSGKEPKKGQKVQIIYRAYLMNGREIDCQMDPQNPRTIELGKEQMAHGVEVMVSQMHVGDAVTCVVPSRHAFGESGNEEYNILPFTPVIFDIELLKIVK